MNASRARVVSCLLTLTLIAVAAVAPRATIAYRAPERPRKGVRSRGTALPVTVLTARAMVR